MAEFETTFADLGLKAPILEALNDLGYEKPSPIQAECIPHLLRVRESIVITLKKEECRKNRVRLRLMKNYLIKLGIKFPLSKMTVVITRILFLTHPLL